MLKFLLIALVLAAIWFIFFRKPTVHEEKEEKEKQKPSVNEEVMVQCATCNTYVSNKEALIRDGRFFCSQECLEHK